MVGWGTGVEMAAGSEVAAAIVVEVASGAEVAAGAEVGSAACVGGTAVGAGGGVAAGAQETAISAVTIITSKKKGYLVFIYFSLRNYRFVRGYFRLFESSGAYARSVERMGSLDAIRSTLNLFY
jgi:hypothetical protein